MKRRWLPCQTENETDSRITMGEPFRVMSWNILADTAVQDHYETLYRQVPSVFLDWNGRKYKVLKEIEALRPHILCLQEVDHFEELKEDLRFKGYDGIFKARTGNRVDGCATFWLREEFELVESESIEFCELGLRDNVALLTTLQSRSETSEVPKKLKKVEIDSKGEREGGRETTSKKLVVTNIHVLFNPKRGDMKLGQVRVLLEKAKEVSGKFEGAPVISTGDFNFTPCSGVYEFLSTGQLDFENYDRRTLGGKLAPNEMNRFSESNGRMEEGGGQLWLTEEKLAATGQSEGSKVTHSLHSLKSAYLQAKRQGMTNQEPDVTSCHLKFCGTVDYIWYTDSLRSLRVLDTPPVSVVDRFGGLPSRDLPSDHLSLVCDFLFTD